MNGWIMKGAVDEWGDDEGGGGEWVDDELVDKKLMNG